MSSDDTRRDESARPASEAANPTSDTANAPVSQPTDGAGSPDPSSADKSTVAVADGRDPMVVLLAKLGHKNDAKTHLAQFLAAYRHFDGGDYRSARAVLDDLAQQKTSNELAHEVLALVKRMRPDKVAIAIAVICLVALIVVWIAAV